MKTEHGAVPGGSRSWVGRRVRTVPVALLAGTILLSALSAPGAAQAPDRPHEDAPGVAWRLVRGGGGLRSPFGTTGHALRGVAASENLVVAVGDVGTIGRSSEGHRWSEASVSATESWLKDVVWGAGRFVAVGDYAIVHSLDGEYWRPARQSSWNLESIAWGERRFVAVGPNGTVVHSDNGIRWHRARQSATGSDLHGVAWGGDRFVAVGSDGTIVQSRDGQRWQSAADTGTSEALLGVAWNGERFVAVGGDAILHSSDGDHWRPAGGIADRRSRVLHDVAWNGSRFVAVGDFEILHSGDGDRWQAAASQVEDSLIGGILNLYGVTGHPGGFVAVGWGGEILHSGDGIGWRAATDMGGGVPLPALSGIAGSEAGFVAVDWTGSILHSRNGELWREASFREGLYGLISVEWVGNRFVAVGGGATIGFSEDGDRWRHAQAGGRLHAVAWSGERYVAVGLRGLIVHSDDGDRWSRVTASATAETLNDVAWNGERFVAVGHHGAIVHSRDGERWQPASRPAVPLRVPELDDDPYDWFYYFSGIAWNGDRFVAVGWGGNDHVGAVALSHDGDRWELASDHEYLADKHFEGVAWSGERFVAVGNDGEIMYSSDGDHWEPARTTATLDVLWDVAWGSGRFVAVGWNGTILTSP